MQIITRVDRITAAAVATVLRILTKELLCARISNR